MSPVQVHKFGGTSLADAQRMRSAANILNQIPNDPQLVVVASAMGGVTDQLTAAIRLARGGEGSEANQILESLRERHLETLRAWPGREEANRVRTAIHEILDEASDLLRAAACLGEVSGRIADRVLSAGEKLSTRLLSLAGLEAGLAAQPIDADTFLETDQQFGEAEPVPGIAERQIRNGLARRIEEGVVPIVGGFTGLAPDGATTTLGRGGSDLTATLLGAALEAEKVVIWTDVSGFQTADPRIVAEAQPLEQINFREAAELSFYGAKVLHPKTIIPVATKGIPVEIRNTLDPESSRTIVDGRYTTGSHPVKAISAIREQALVSVEGKGMAGLPGVAARLFGSLAAEAISVTMICQSSSESSICLAIPAEAADQAEVALKREFRTDISSGRIDDISVTREVGLVAAVGLGMAHTPGVSGRVFGALAQNRINVLAIAQGSSELNITVAVHEPQIDAAVRAIHHKFRLHRIDTGEDSPEGLDLLILGWGNIGRAVTQLADRQAAHLQEEIGLRPRVVAVCDRSGFLFAPSGISQERLERAAAAKEEGHPLRSFEDSHAIAEPMECLDHVLRYRLTRPILVDTSDYQAAHRVFHRALEGGCDIVTANKFPLAGEFEVYQNLLRTADRANRTIKAEATVGAGLPVVDTLEMLLATGDQLQRAEGCLSGTLAFLLGQMERGQPFSEAVAEAARLGYTEPDPVADLSGEDVARKAIILGRLSGLTLGSEGVELEGLVDASLAGLDLSDLLSRLKAYDQPLADRISQARAQGKVVRYVAQVLAGRIQVGLSEFPTDSPIGRLEGTDNTVVFTSDRYQARPLVVTGPGAGIDVTAMGVLGDIFRVARLRR